MDWWTGSRAGSQGRGSEALVSVFCSIKWAHTCVAREVKGVGRASPGGSPLPERLLGEPSSALRLTYVVSVGPGGLGRGCCPEVWMVAGVATGVFPSNRITVEI